jgi:hypothetical protein
MVTDYAGVMVGTQPVAKVPQRSFLARALRRVGQKLCGLRGHDLVKRYERHRVALECATCGHVSPGWEVSGAIPHLRYAGDPGRHQLPQRPRVSRVTRVA